MKIFNLFYLILSFLFISCNKDNDTRIINEPDNILFTDVINDSIITSIDSLVLMGNQESEYCYKPFPEDSIAFFDLDLNNDSIPDFSISHSHWYYDRESTPTSWCHNFKNYCIEINSYNENKICSDSTNTNTGFGYVPKPINYGDTLNNDNFWKSRITGYINSSQCYCVYKHPTNYIGLRLNKNDISYNAWLDIEMSDYEFKIKEYAINMVDNKPIIVGQKK